MDFFAAVSGCKFSVRAIVIEKAKIYSSYLRTEADSFYNFFVNKLIQHDGGVLQGASIKIDGSGDREFRRALETYLRRQVAVGKIAKFRFAESHRDNLIQLADMVTGAIARSYSNRPDADRWRQQIKRKIGDVWEFR